MLQKYFIAVLPPEPLLTQLFHIKQSVADEYQTKGALRSPAHITLHMPFIWDEIKEEKLISILSQFQFDDEFVIHLKNFNCFEPRVVFVEVKHNDVLNNLQRELVKHVKINLQLFNQSDDRRGFHPHITVAFRDLKKKQFYKVWEEYQYKKLHEDFICSSFSLLKHVNDKWEVYKEFNFN